MTSGSVSALRLWLLRVAYLIIAAGMGATIIPEFLYGSQWELMEGVVNAMLLALVLLCLIGLRHPLKMLPVLFWELLWKIIWLSSVAAPMAVGSGLDAETANIAIACAMVGVIALFIPWDYVWKIYVINPVKS